MTDAYAAQKSRATLPEDQTRPARLIQGVFVIEVGWILGAGLWIGLWSGVLTPTDTTALAAIVTLLTHGVLLGVTLMVVRAAQRRGFWDIVGPWEPALRDFLSVLIWGGGLVAALFLWSATELSAMPEVTQKPLLPWLLLLPLAGAAILLQTAAEEIYFRGYIQNTLAARFANPMVWMVLPSLFFGLLHWTAEAGPIQAVQTVAITTVFGLAAADLTARSGNLGAAIALHFTYNAGLMLTSSTAGTPVSGLALFLFPEGAADQIETGPLLSMDLMIWLVFLAVLWLAARNAIRR